MRRAVNPAGQLRRWGSRFDASEVNPMDSTGNLVDVMLVFACGLMAALLLGDVQLPEPVDAAADPSRSHDRAPREMTVRRGKELPSAPEGVQQRGSGFEEVGRVFRDPKTNKLILVGAEPGSREPSDTTGSN